MAQDEIARSGPAGPVSLSMILNQPDPEFMETLPADLPTSPCEDFDDDVIFMKSADGSTHLANIMEVEELQEEDTRGQGCLDVETFDVEDTDSTGLGPAENTLTQFTMATVLESNKTELGAAETESEAPSHKNTVTALEAAPTTESVLGTELACSSISQQTTDTDKATPQTTDNSIKTVESQVEQITSAPQTPDTGIKTVVEDVSVESQVEHINIPTAPQTTERASEMEVEVTSLIKDTDTIPTSVLTGSNYADCKSIHDSQGGPQTPVAETCDILKETSIANESLAIVTLDPPQAPDTQAIVTLDQPQAPESQAIVTLDPPQATETLAMVTLDQPQAPEVLDLEAKSIAASSPTDNGTEKEVDVEIVTHTVETASLQVQVDNVLESQQDSQEEVPQNIGVSETATPQIPVSETPTDVQQAPLDIVGVSETTTDVQQAPLDIVGVSETPTDVQQAPLDIVGVSETSRMLISGSIQVPSTQSEDASRILSPNDSISAAPIHISQGTTTSPVPSAPRAVEEMSITKSVASSKPMITEKIVQPVTETLEPKKLSELSSKQVASQKGGEKVAKEKKGVFSKILEFVGVSPKTKKEEESKSVFYDSELDVESEQPIGESARSAFVPVAPPTAIQRASPVIFETSFVGAGTDKPEEDVACGETIEEILKATDLSCLDDNVDDVVAEMKELADSIAAAAEGETIESLTGKLRELTDDLEREEGAVATAAPDTSKRDTDELTEEQTIALSKVVAETFEKIISVLEDASTGPAGGAPLKRSPSPRVIIGARIPETKITSPTPPTSPQGPPLLKEAKSLSVEETIPETPPLVPPQDDADSEKKTPIILENNLIDDNEQLLEETESLLTEINVIIEEAKNYVESRVASDCCNALQGIGEPVRPTDDTAEEMLSGDSVPYVVGIGEEEEAIDPDLVLDTRAEEEVPQAVFLESDVMEVMNSNLPLGTTVGGEVPQVVCLELDSQMEIADDKSVQILECDNEREDETVSPDLTVTKYDVLPESARNKETEEVNASPNSRQADLKHEDAASRCEPKVSEDIVALTLVESANKSNEVREGAVVAGRGGVRFHDSMVPEKAVRKSPSPGKEKREGSSQTETKLLVCLRAQVVDTAPDEDAAEPQQEYSEEDVLPTCQVQQLEATTPASPESEKEHSGKDKLPTCQVQQVEATTPASPESEKEHSGKDILVTCQKQHADETTSSTLEPEEPIYSNLEAVDSKLIPIKRETSQVEEIKVTAPEERQKHKGQTTSSKLSGQILKAIPPPRRKAISEAKARGRPADRAPLKADKADKTEPETVVKVTLDRTILVESGAPPPVPPRRNRSRQRDPPLPPPKRKTKK